MYIEALKPLGIKLLSDLGDANMSSLGPEEGQNEFWIAKGEAVLSTYTKLSWQNLHSLPSFRTGVSELWSLHVTDLSLALMRLLRCNWCWALPTSQDQDKHMDKYVDALHSLRLCHGFNDWRRLAFLHPNLTATSSPHTQGKTLTWLEAEFWAWNTT